MRKISLAIPSWNRVQMTMESFDKVYDDERINEIIIVDDASDKELYHDLRNRVDGLKKIKLFRNATNKDCYENKMIAISFATNDFAILLDSDNIIDVSYLDILYAIKEWDKKTIYTPFFAEPQFDFTNFSGLLISKENVSEWIDQPMFEVMLNASNYFVNKNEYLKVWDESINPITSDSIYLCYKWLQIGNKIQVVEGLKYFHRIHNGSHYQNNVNRTPQGFHESVLNNLRQLV